MYQGTHCCPTLLLRQEKRKKADKCLVFGVIVIVVYKQLVLLLLYCIVTVNITVVSSLDPEDCLDDLSKDYDEGNVKLCVLNN